MIKVPYRDNWTRARFDSVMEILNHAVSTKSGPHPVGITFAAARDLLSWSFVVMGSRRKDGVHIRAADGNSPSIVNDVMTFFERGGFGDGFAVDKSETRWSDMLEARARKEEWELFV